MYSLADYSTKVDDILQNPDISLLIFIDGDQMEKNLLERLKEVQYEKRFHVFVTTGKGCVTNRSITEYAPWFTWIEAQSCLKNAADTAIIAQVFLAAFRMQRPTQICVYTTDHFGRTLQKEVEGLGRSCDIVNAYSMDLNLYVITELPKEELPFEARDIKDRLNARVIDVDTISKLYCYKKSKIVAELERRREIDQRVGIYKKDLPAPKLTPKEATSQSYTVLNEIKSLLHERGMITVGEIGHLFSLSPEMRSTFCIGSWTQLLSHPTILMHLSAQLIVENKSVTYLSLVDIENYGYFSQFKSAEELTDNELIWVWKRFWKNCDINVFAKLSNISDKTFRNWLVGREKSPVSATSVRNWITENEIDY